MLYQPPTGMPADSPYVGANPGAGIVGSKVPPKAIEHQQRELVALITKSGIAPSESDLTQVAQAARSQALNYVATVGGTANAMTATLDPAPASWAELAGTPIRLRITAANTSTAVTFAPNALAAKAIVYNDASLPRPGDLTGIVEVVYNPASDKLQVVSLSRQAILNVQRSQVTADRGASSQLTGDSVITRVTGYGSVSSSFQGGSTFSGGILTIGAADAGLWSLAGHTRQPFALASGFALYLYRNSTALVSDGGPAAGGSISHGSVSRIVQLAAGDTVDIRLIQTTGADFTFNDLYGFGAVRLGA